MSNPWNAGEMLGFDLETTGVDVFTDVPVAFGLVSANGGVIIERETGLVDPGRDIPPGATAVHGITTERARSEGAPLATVVGDLASTLVGKSLEGIPVVGMNISFDLTILDHQHRATTGRGLSDLGWHGPVIDVLVLDRHFDRYRKGRRTLPDLCTYYGVETCNAHDAGADAEAAVMVLQAICLSYPQLTAMDLPALAEAQALWHQEWSDGYDKWRQSRGQKPTSRREVGWPIARPASRVAAPVSDA